MLFFSEFPQIAGMDAPQGAAFNAISCTENKNFNSAEPRPATIAPAERMIRPSLEHALISI
jgi:hypothetical protein